MQFLDQAKVYVRSGDGGNGSVSFRREKFVEFGGPDGGDGGRGGDVIVECVANLNTLLDYRYRQHFKAKKGGHGMGQNRSGAKGRVIRINNVTGVLNGALCGLGIASLPDYVATQYPELIRVLP